MFPRFFSGEKSVFMVFSKVFCFLMVFSMIFEGVFKESVSKGFCSRIFVWIGHFATINLRLLFW